MESMKATKDLRPSWKCCGIAYLWFMSTLIKFSFFRNLSSKYASSFFYDAIIMIFDNIILCNKTIVYGSHDTAINASFGFKLFSFIESWHMTHIHSALNLITYRGLYRHQNWYHARTIYQKIVIFFFSSKKFITLRHSLIF